MFKTLSNSWNLAKECWQVLMLDKEMLVYPTLTSIINLCIIAIAYIYFMALGFAEAEVPFQYSNQQWIGGIALAVSTIYACHFTFSFFECALVASAIKRLRGENPTLGYGLGVAANRLPQLAAWSFYVTILGILLSLLKSLIKSRWIQRIVGKIVETGWNVVTVFVLPLIVVENTGSMDAIKQSAKLVKSKWGEAATLEIGFGSLCSIAGFPLAMLFIASHMVNAASPIAAAIIMIVAIVLGAFLGLVFSALSGIAKAVLFNFAIDGNIPDEIHMDTLDNTIGHRDDTKPIVERRIQT